MGRKRSSGIEGEVAGVVVGEIVSAVAIADDEELEEAEERLGVAVAGVVLVIDDLLHGPARVDAESLQLDLHAGHAIDQKEDVVAVVAVVRVDAKLVDDLEGVFAPVLDVDQGVVQWRAVVAGEGVDLAESLGGGEDIGRDDLFEQAGELGVGEADTVQSFEFFAEVFLQRGAVADVGPVGVFQAAQLFDEFRFDVLLIDGERPGIRVLPVDNLRGHMRYQVRASSWLQSCVCHLLVGTRGRFNVSSASRRIARTSSNARGADMNIGSIASASRRSSAKRDSGGTSRSVPGRAIS